MSELLSTNVGIFKAIAEEAYEEMNLGIEAGRRPAPDGRGWIKSYDPTQATFKQAMVSIVFTGLWLEAMLHLWIVREFDERTFEQYDRTKTYEEKLKLLGFEDEDVFQRVARFRKTRRELVHEKAYTDSGEIKTAQEEAENAHHVRVAIESYLASRAG